MLVYLNYLQKKYFEIISDNNNNTDIIMVYLVVSL